MLRALSIVAVLVVGGCAVENTALEAPSLDLDEFRCNVEPVLMARCAFYPCHGTESRPFRVFAPNRMRIAPSVPQLAMPLSAEEREANYQSALEFARGETAAESLLVGKPLDVDAGGQFHKGKSIYRGRDVFSTDADLGHQRLVAWIEGATAPANCQPAREVGP